jgi:hypothetical protein
MEFVRKITQDDFVIISNRLKSDFSVIFYKQDDPSILESFRIPSKVKNIRVTLYKSGTLLVRGDAATPEYQHVIDTISSVIEF